MSEDFTILGTVEVDDSSVANLRRIADEAFGLSSKLDDLSSSAQNSASGFSMLVSPLDEVEQAQMANVAAAGQLEQAQTLLSSSQQNLNQVIVEYGADSEQAATALRDMNDAQTTVNSMQGQLSSSVTASSVSMKDFAVSMSGVATSAFSLYSSFERVENASVSLDRANLMVKRSDETVEAAQKKYNDLLANSGVNPEKVAAAQQKLADANFAAEKASVALQNAQDSYNASPTEIKSRNLSIQQENLTRANEAVTVAQDNLNKVMTTGGASAEDIKTAYDRLQIATEGNQVANERAEMAQRNYNNSVIASTLQVVPSLITMGTNVSTLYKNLSSIDTVTFSNLATQIGSLQTKLGGLASFAGTLIPLTIALAVTWEWNQIAQDEVKKRVAATTGMTPENFKTLPPETQNIITNPYGKNVSPLNPKNNPLLENVPFIGGRAEGAYVTSPVSAIVGEGGEPEIITPESKMREIVGESHQPLNINVYPYIVIEKMDQTFDLSQLQDAVSNGTGDALDKVLGQMYKRLS